MATEDFGPICSQEDHAPIMPLRPTSYIPPPIEVHTPPLTPQKGVPQQVIVEPDEPPVEEEIQPKT